MAEVPSRQYPTAPLALPPDPDKTGGRALGVLLVHGYTGSPASMKPWAHALHEHHEIKRVEIQGHTDNVGDSAYNLKLGQERSDSVKHALIKRGIAPARLSAKGYGESDPIAPNATPAGRAKNRRVDFVIVN